MNNSLNKQVRDSGSVIGSLTESEANFELNMIQKLIYFFRLLKAMTSLERNPAKVESLLSLSISLRKLGAFKQLNKILDKSPESKDLIKFRKMLNPTSVEILQGYPKGSLGREFADFMVLNKLDVDFYPRISVKADEQYVLMRLKQIHPILMVVGGFEANQIGELGIQAFIMAQLASPISMILIGRKLLSLPFRKQESLFASLNSVVRGWILGRESKLCFAVDWDAQWHVSLRQIRRTLGLEVSLDQILDSGPDNIVPDSSLQLELESVASADFTAAETAPISASQPAAPAPAATPNATELTATEQHRSDLKLGIRKELRDLEFH